MCMIDYDVNVIANFKILWLQKKIDATPRKKLGSDLKFGQQIMQYNILIQQMQQKLFWPL